MPKTLEELKKEMEASKIECLICHQKFFSLAGHLQESHKLSVGAYKNRHTGAETTSSVIQAIMKQRPRQKYTTTNIFDSVWEQMKAWDSKEIEKLGLSLPHKHPELVPIKDEFFQFQKREASILGLSVSEGMNLFISGPTECGKTALVEQAHAYMNRPILRCNMTGDTTVKNFVGQMQLDANGTFFKKGILLQAMEAGCTLLIDEIDFMPPHIGAVLHPVLEKGRSVYVPDLATTIKAEPGFTVIATANTGGKGDKAGIYTGTEVLNTAFLDRFQMRLEMAYLPEGVETRIMTDRFPKSDQTFVKGLITFAREVREAFQQGSIEITLGTRKLNDFLRITEKMGAEEAYRLVIEDWLSVEEKKLMEELKGRCFPKETPKL